jgi:putative flavoprotein involved in K+ transport
LGGSAEVDGDGQWQAGFWLPAGSVMEGTVMNHLVDTPLDTAHRYLEQGEALNRICGGRPPRAGGNGPRPSYDVIVIGAGQAGLSTGYHLARQGLRFVILEANDRIGDTWRQRWDSLRLFTHARFDGLDGMRFPAPRNYFPTKDEMADYLESYAARFELPVKTATRVTRLSRAAKRFLVTTDQGDFEASQVVVAMANYQQPKVPAFAADLDRGIVQLHSGEYRNPGQLQAGAVLIVGAGNSGAEIAKELAAHHTTLLSGRHTGHLPFRTDSLAGRNLFAPLVLRLIFHRVLTLKTPIGRRLRPKIISEGGPLIRVKPRHLAAAGVQWLPRVAGTSTGRPQLEDGRVLDIANVIWCTGFHPGFSWIDLPVLDDAGYPRQIAGVVDDAPGLYFVGLHFLYAVSSGMIHGVGRDAARIAAAAGRHARTSPTLSSVDSAISADSKPASHRAVS